MNRIDELKRLAEKKEEFVSTEYIKRVYNTHAKSYNEKTPKREAYEDIRYVSDELEKDMTSIRDNLGAYGIHPYDLPIIDKQGKEGNISVDETAENINRYFKSVGLTPDDFKPIATLSRIYLEHDANWGPIQFLKEEITDNGFPPKIPLWDELLEGEQKEIETRGRKPNNASVKRDIKNYYREHRDRLEDQNKDQEGYPVPAKIARQILEEKDEDIGISDEYKDTIRTITRCMNEVKRSMQKMQN